MPISETGSIVGGPPTVEVGWDKVVIVGFVSLLQQ